MNGQFKHDNFSSAQLQRFTDDLIQAGLPLNAEWKKGTKTLEESTADADTLTLEINGKWFFRQVKNKGYVRLKYLDEQEKNNLLNLIHQHGFYSEPDWALGIGLVILYVFIELAFALTHDQSWVKIILLPCCIFVILFLWIAYLHSVEKAGESLYKVSIVFGVIGYFFTAIASLLALPLFINIGINYLKTQVLMNQQEENA
ncbi:hypothetical protein TH53_07805 [Pedobacter lusitanus]|uniref:Uncharacterized protein n=1 Tax=Pedobacter lusitanus TaxID=1503925 RepID=A0A0D0FZ73_9SPHI|nr:hypothetical protein [Pedobacter lusitanus]KIO77809.1 hypothetical protein TH53_07805 [Pedobacter lusitanus]